MSQRPVSLPAVRLSLVTIESLAIAIEAEVANYQPERAPGALARLGALASSARAEVADAIALAGGQHCGHTPTRRDWANLGLYALEQARLEPVDLDALRVNLEAELDDETEDDLPRAVIRG